MVIKLISVLAIAYVFSATPSTNALDVHCDSDKIDGCHVKKLNNIYESTTLNFIDADKWNDTSEFEITSGTNITIIPSGVFTRFPNLVNVRISSSGLKAIQPNDFKNAVALSFLNLQGNNLQVLPNGVFSKSTELFSLDLQQNELTTIEDYAFSGLYNLWSLSLQNNSLTSLKRNTFSGASNLTIIYLEHNRIETIEDGAFDLPKLNMLILSHNLISTLSDNVFGGAPDLRMVVLVKNELTHIGQSFYKCQKLYAVSLNNNTINDIDLLSFAKLPVLNSLLLRNTGFRFQDNTAVFAHTVNSTVADLNLSDNGLTNSDVLQRLESIGFVNLHYLNLRNNNLTDVDGINEVNQKFQKLSWLGLSGNRLSSAFLENARQTLKKHKIGVS